MRFRKNRDGLLGPDAVEEATRDLIGIWAVAFLCMLAVTVALAAF